MNVDLLIDSIVRQTTVLIAQLATAAGGRAPLAHTANQVFADLIRELKEQGLGTKVIADMFGLTLRTYHNRVRRLAESSTFKGRSVWEAVLRDLVTIGRRAGDAPESCALSNAAGPCPVNLFDILGKDAYQGPFTLRATLVPSGNDHPILKWWEIRFSCIDPRFTLTCEYGGRTWSNNPSFPRPVPKMPTVGCNSGCRNGEVSRLIADALGPCVECRSTSDCANGEYCDQTATCGTADPGPGRCLAMPNSCTLSGDKVCGCDGTTYDNTCLAARAGTGIAYAAACGAPAPCWEGEIVSSQTGTCVCVNGTPSDCLSNGK
jgi:hypothetical protein